MTDDSFLGQLAEEFTHRVREGQLLDIEEYANQYPELAVRIRALFPTLMLLEGMAGADSSAAAEAMPSPLSAGSVFGNYRIQREIGRGGMGIVYEAVHVLLEKRVALKVLPVRTLAGPEHLERFFREARTAAGLHHTNIVPVFDVGQVAGTPYYAMQFIEGSGLDQILRIMQTATEHGPVDQAARIQAGLPGRPEDYFRWVAGLGIQAAEGLAYAHERKIMHRDIKPSNLLLDKQGVLWIADFGLARKIEDQALTQSGMMLGTPRYMSPEQAESARRPVDQRSDTYSLGATLYELLTCRPVFEGKTPQEVLSQIVTREPVAPRRLNRQIPADLAIIVMKAMAKRPEDRYQSARGLADDLDRWQKMEPIKARPIGLLGRTVRWCRRNPRLAAVTGAAAVSVLILSGLYYHSLVKENAATRAALDLAVRQSYAANLTSADLQLSIGNTDDARRRLALCEPALRGWEWGHLIAKVDSSLATLPVVAGSFDNRAPYWSSTFGFSADGTRMFWNTRRTLHVWERATNRQLAVYGGFGPILAVKRDGSRILAGMRLVTEGSSTLGVDGPMRIVNPVSGQVEWSFAPVNDFVTSAAFSSDGTRLATGYNSGKLRIWDATSGKALIDMAGAKSSIFHVVFSQDGSQIAATSANNTLILWSLPRGLKVKSFRQNEFITCSNFSHDHKQLAVGLWSGRIQVYDISSGKVTTTITGNNSFVGALAYSLDDSRIASGGFDGVRIWEASSGKQTARLTGYRSLIGVNSIAFTPDGSRILSGGQLSSSNYGEVLVWDASKSGGRTILSGHQDGVNSVAFSPDGTKLVSASKDKTVRLWEIESGKEILRFNGHQGQVGSVSFSPDGTRVASASDDSSVRVWDVHSAGSVSVHTSHKSDVNSVAFSPDGTRLATGSQDNTARIWDAGTGRLILTITLRDPVNAVAFSSNGAEIVTGSGVIKSDNLGTLQQGEVVQIWDAVSGKKLASMGGKYGLVISVAFSPDRLRVATVNAFTSYGSGEVNIWDAITGRPSSKLMGHSGMVSSVAYSPDGKRLVTGGMSDGSVRLWDASSYEPLLTLTSDAKEGVICVAISPDGTRIAAGNGKTITIWDSRSAYNFHSRNLKEILPPLFERFAFAGEIVQYLQADKELDPDLRAAAVQYVQARGDSPSELNTRSRDIVKSPVGTMADYRKALKMAEAAARITPWDLDILTMLGIAQYRAQDYAVALATLESCENKRPDSVAEDLAFIAMAHFKLGHAEQARSALDQLRTIMKAPALASHAELQKRFLREAVSLIGGPPLGKIN